jgi:hypothetical protein
MNIVLTKSQLDAVEARAVLCRLTPGSLLKTMTVADGCLCLPAYLLIQPI